MITKLKKVINDFFYYFNILSQNNLDFSLVPSKYIEFVNRDENIDFDEKMTSLKGEFAELLKVEEQSKRNLLEVFKNLGYGIKF